MMTAIADRRIPFRRGRLGDTEGRCFMHVIALADLERRFFGASAWRAKERIAPSVVALFISHGRSNESRIERQDLHARTRERT